MSLFPAYEVPPSNEPSHEEELEEEEETNKEPKETVAETQEPPSWLTNTSFKDFQEKVNKVQPIEIASSEEEDDGAIRISSGASSSEEDKKKKKRRRRSRSSSSSSSRSRSRRRSGSMKRKSKRSRSRKKRKRRSRSRSRNRRRSRSSSRENRRGRSSPSRSRDERMMRDRIIANSKKNSKKNFIEEVGVGVANSFREDRTGDKTNLTGVGMYSKDVAQYRCKLRHPLGQERKRAVLAKLQQNPRFHSRTYLKQLLKTKHVRRINKDRVKRSQEDMEGDFVKTYLDLACHSAVVKQEVEDDYSSYNPLGIYDQKTEQWARGVGGLAGQEEEEVFENDEMQSKRLEFNRRLRDCPTDVNTWIEFIDFQDMALEETVFRQEEGAERSSRRARKERGEILRAKALTERKLAICRSAIEKNTRSVLLAVKRLELSRDLFDSATLDEQWKELIWVYPENISLWKRYLLFVQTHYIRFSITDTVKAYKGCIQTLRKKLEQRLEDKEEGAKVLELEHGILDMIEQGNILLLQSGHTEKAVAIYQAMLELNLFSPPGYTVEDKLSLMEPIWDSGLAKVGQAGARGWGEELHDRIAKGNREMDEGEERREVWQEEVLARGLGQGACWLQLEVGREREQFFPWRQGEEEPDDPDRVVDFDTIAEWLVEFSRPETKFRLVLSLLRLLGVRWPDRQFGPLVHSAAADSYLCTAGHQGQDFSAGGAQLLQPVLPEVHSQESLAIFTHFLLAQTYARFPDPYRSRLMCLWLDFEFSLVERHPENTSLRKNLRKLAKSLLKEDRNNVELVVQFAELESKLGGYSAGQAVLEASILAGGRVLLLQEEEGDVVAASRLYRAAAELELRELVKCRAEGGQEEGLHRDRLQWLLLQVGAKSVFKSLDSSSKASMLGLEEVARRQYEEWLARRMEDPRKRIRVFQQAPFIRHSGSEVLFLYSWLLYFSLGPGEALEALAKYSATLGREVQGAQDRLEREERRSEEMLKSGGRYDEELQTLRFIQESVDKVAFDMLWFSSLDDVSMRQRLREFYLSQLARYPGSGHLEARLPAVEASTSLVSAVWRQVCKAGLGKDSRGHGLLEQVSMVSLSKLSSVLGPSGFQDLPALAVGLLNRLRHLLEKFTSVAGVRNSPLLWRLLLWATSLITIRLPGKDAGEELKTVLYRAIQEVPWCKALYLDTALYLDRRDQLYCTTKREIKWGEGEDHPDDELVEPKFEEIPGTLEHVTELMVEKDLRVRLPLPELEVLLEPV